jgi:hypothetical protein
LAVLRIRKRGAGVAAPAFRVSSDKQSFLSGRDRVKPISPIQDAITRLLWRAPPNTHDLFSYLMRHPVDRAPYTDLLDKAPLAPLECREDAFLNKPHGAGQPHQLARARTTRPSCASPWGESRSAGSPARRSGLPRLCAGDRPVADRPGTPTPRSRPASSARFALSADTTCGSAIGSSIAVMGNRGPARGHGALGAFAT